jgi:hypothetical protein
VTDEQITVLLWALIERQTGLERRHLDENEQWLCETSFRAGQAAQAAEIARLREALGFYANLPCRLEFGVVNECPYDDGDTARAALAQEAQP